MQKARAAAAQDCIDSSDAVSSSVGASAVDASTIEGVVGMKDAKTLWEDMIIRRDYRDVNQALWPTASQSLDSLSAIAFSGLDLVDSGDLPKILLFGMSLKRTDKDVADDIIKSAIKKMAEINVKKSVENKSLQESFKIAIDEILSIDGAPGLLEGAVQSMEQNFRYEYNSTILHKAAHNGHPEIVRLLFAGGWKNVDPVDELDKTPIYFSIVSQHVDAVKELLLHNPNLIRDDSAFRPIAIAIRHLDIWNDIFIEYAQEHKPHVPTLLSHPMLADISRAVHIRDMNYIDLHNFYEKMNFDVSNIGEILEN